MPSTVLVGPHGKALISCQAITLPGPVTSCVLPRRSQHIFVRSDGRSGDSLAYTCVGDPGNALTCNDGYHVRSMAYICLPNQHRFLSLMPSLGKCCLRRSLKWPLRMHE